MPVANPNVDVFDRDATSNVGYLYTTNNSLSSKLATSRSARMILQLGHFTGRSIIDIGCGDGHFTLRYWDYGRPKTLVGVDGAEHAIEVANERKQHRPIEFVVGDAHDLPYANDSFDVALVQSILHHDDDPRDIIREAFRLAPEVLIHEPNGNNYGLKIIEKVSHYHREHNEKSYSSRQIDRWVEEVGGTVVRRQFAGFVPMFCPDWVARPMKAVEPIVEHMPLANALGCSVYVVVGKRN
jgi:ubiquinone/menaquinone biosynthesis C-methylase UbiE